MASICGSPVCAGGKPKMKFTYTGDYVVRKDGVVELLTSGTIVFLNPETIDIFCVGGGGAGGGGVVNSSGASLGGDGGTTSFGALITAAGGGGGGGLAGVPNRLGGSGGGAASYSSTSASSSFGATAGGVDGSDGTPSSNSSYNANHLGKGQGATTREFSESIGTIYAGGGGGGGSRGAFVTAYQNGAAGGAGGGGDGGNVDPNTKYSYAGEAGTANTGGGGGGGAAYSSGSVAVGGGGGNGGFTNTLFQANVTGEYNVVIGAGGTPNTTGKKQGGMGGSGIVCFRYAQELPELAGTWKLHEKLYVPDTMPFTENVNFSSTNEAGGAASENNQCIFRTQYGVSYFEIHSTSLAKTVTVYTFNTDSWTNKWINLTFPAGATASDAFRAWLASNATKQ